MEGDGVAELREKHPAWEIGVSFGRPYARWLKTSPPVRLTAPTAGKLADMIAAAEKAGRELPYSYRAVIEAASKAMGPE